MLLVKKIVLPLIGAALRHIVCDQPAPPPPPPPVRLPTEAQIDTRLKLYADQQGASDLDWRNSIVDLLKLLGIKDGFGSRACLWSDLGHAGDYKGSEEQNKIMLAEVRHLWAMGDL